MTMRCSKIDGTWTGLCRYDAAAEMQPSFPDSFHGVPFDLELRVGWFGRLRGEIRDDARFTSDSEPAPVRGWLRGAVLNFRMTRRRNYVMDDGVIIPLSEFLKKHWKREIDWSGPVPIAHYRGEVDAQNRRISGVWSIPPSIVRVRLSGVIHELPPAPETTGTWFVERKSMNADR